MAKSKSSDKPKVRKPRRVKPQVYAVVACDSIHQQMPSGKPIVAGVFDRIIIVDENAKTFRPFSVWTKLFGGKGKFEVGLAIQSPDKKIRKSATAETVDFNPELVMQGAIIIEGLDISKPGMYKIFVTLDGEFAGNPCPMRIVHSPKDIPEVSKD